MEKVQGNIYVSCRRQDVIDLQSSDNRMNAYENLDAYERFKKLKSHNKQKCNIEVDDDIKQLINPLKYRQDNYEKERIALFGCQHKKKSTSMKVNLFTYFIKNCRIRSNNNGCPIQDRIIKLQESKRKNRRRNSWNSSINPLIHKKTLQYQSSGSICLKSKIDDGNDSYMHSLPEGAEYLPVYPKKRTDLQKSEAKTIWKSRMLTRRKTVTVILY